MSKLFESFECQNYIHPLFCVGIGKTEKEKEVCVHTSRAKRASQLAGQGVE